MENAKERTIFTYEIPPTVSTSITSIGVKMLTVGEEQQAHKRSGGDNLKAGNELVKTSLVEATVDGEELQLKLSDGSVDKFWNDAPPTIRQLAATAYHDVNMAKDEDVKPFLASRKARVG